MYTHSIDLQLPKQVLLEFHGMIDKFEQVIRNNTLKNEIILCAWSSDVTPGTKMFITSDDVDNVRFSAIEQLDWAVLEKEIPGLVEFYNKYPIEKTFSQLSDSIVPPHRHRHSVDSCWTLTFINSNEEGLLKFYEPKDPDKFVEEEKITWDMDIWNCIEEFVTAPHSVYGFDTWNWHGWKTTAINPKITNFCLKNADSRESAMRIMQNLVP